MKYKYKVNGLDCANCTQKLEDALNKKEAESLKETLEKITLDFKVKTGEGGRIFGGVSTKHIVEKLYKDYQIKIDKRKKTERIDIIDALINAFKLARCINQIAASQKRMEASIDAWLSADW